MLGLVLVASGLSPSVAADHRYEQPVNWNRSDPQVDVLVLGAEDPLVGAPIQHAIQVWKDAIDEMGPDAFEDPSLAEELALRVYWPGSPELPPSDFDPRIYFVPQGFFTAYSYVRSPPTCIATAPLPTANATFLYDYQAYRTAAHEFGHCLGISHAFNHGVEYEPDADLMGGHHSLYNEGPGHACPSNLNLLAIEHVFTGVEENATIASEDYEQTDCPEYRFDPLDVDRPEAARTS